MAGIHSERDEARWSHLFKWTRQYMVELKIQNKIKQELRVWWVRWITPFLRWRLMTQNGRAGKGPNNVAFESGHLVKLQLDQLLELYPWRSYLTYLYLGFLTYKMEIMLLLLL